MPRGQTTCTWLVNEADEDDEECGKPAVASIRMRNRVNKVKVYICAHHKSLHDRAHAGLRIG